jgi:hypothetical protein
MELRNLSFKYLAPVDTRTDSLLTDGSATGLVLLANGKDNIAAGEMRLYDLIRLTNAVVRTSDAFEKIYAFALEHKETLEARSLVYSLAKPEGAPFYDANKLQELQSLVAIFNRLKFPLAQRMIRMVESGDSCSAVETANYASNGIATRRVLSPCNEEILSAYRDSMRILAHQTGSRVFYRKSQ